MSALPLVVLRPEPGNAATVSAARALGLQAIPAPLFEMVAQRWNVPAASDFDALLLGSANAVRLGGDGLAGLRSVPVYAVGETTAASAAEAGFRVAAHGSGGLQKLLLLLAADGCRRVLRLAGAEKVEIDAPGGVRITTVDVYHAEPLALIEGAQAALTEGAVALLHSAAAARRLGELCTHRGVTALACLGPRIAAAAGPGWKECRSAAQPTDRALLALAATMCQRTWPGDAES